MLENLKLLCFFLKKDYTGIESYLQKGDCDVKSFNDFSNKHGLSGYLYSILSHSRLKNLFPNELIENFKFFYIGQWVNNVRLIREVERLGDLFRESRQEVIFLKGLFLAQRFYGSIYRRAISDIDILVREQKDIDDVQQLLTKHGFKRTSKVPLNKKLVPFFTHHFGYWKPNISVELHWLLQSHFTFRIDYKKIWKSKQKFIFKNKPYYVLCNEYELVAQILSIFTDIQIGKIVLKPFVDIYIILKGISKDLNWEEFFAYRQNEGLFLISLNALDMVLDILDCYDDFEELTVYIEKNRKHLKYQDLRKKLKLLNTSRFGLKNKLWAFGLYQTSLFNSFCWWAVSLPVRLMVYR